MRAINRIPAPQPSQQITDPADQAIARALQARGIEVPGLPQDEEVHWVDILVEHQRRHEEFVANQQAQRQAEAEAETTSDRSVAEILSEEIAKFAQPQPGDTSRATQPPMPLNGAAVLRAALAGGSGTINGVPSA